jgi:hypothetical protein
LGELDARQLKEKLVEAELLLNYAVATGRQVEGTVISGVLEGGAASRSGWTERTATNLLVAEATLAAMLKPVSAESLRNTASYRSRRYRFLLPTTMVILAAVIVFYSTAAFLFSAFSSDIRDSIATANPLAVKLTDELGSAPVTNDPLCATGETPAGPAFAAASPAPAAASPVPMAASPAPGTATPNSPLPAGAQKAYVISDLQTFASSIRDMYGAARQMNRLYPFASKQPDPIVGIGKTFTPGDYAAALELPPGLPDLALAATERICVYQRVRYYAQSTEKNATIFIGAVAACILPVLYALLGAGAYMLRRLETQLRARTFINEASSPRFITAAIAGSVVGLFNFGQGVSVSPLAIAFLAGYAVDVFFSFLESVIETSSKARTKEGSDKPGGPS